MRVTRLVPRLVLGASVAVWACVAARPAHAAEAGCFLLVDGSDAAARQSAVKAVQNGRHHPFCGDANAAPSLIPGVPARHGVDWRRGHPFPPTLFYLLDPASARAGRDEVVTPPVLRVSLTREEPTHARIRFRMGTPHKVSGDAPGNYKPRWSGDGRYLAFQQIGDEPRLLVHEVAASRYLSVPLERVREATSGRDGGGARKGSGKSGGGDEDDEEERALYGGGPQIAWFTWHPTLARLYVKLKGERSFVQVDVAPSGTQVAPATGFPALAALWWSPDGQRIAWRPEGDGAGLRVRDLRTGADLDVCDGETFCRDVRFSSDGRALLFWRTRKDAERFQVMAALLPELPGDPLIVRAASAGFVGAPDGRKQPTLAAAFSPDDTLIAWFEAGRIRVVATRDVFLQAVEGGGVAPKHTLDAQGDADKSDLVWLDGANIAFVQRRGQAFPIAVASLLSGQSVVLGQAFELNYDLALSPDRRTLAFSAFDKQQSIMLGALDRQVPTALARKLGAPRVEVDVAGQRVPVRWGTPASVKVTPRVELLVDGQDAPDGSATQVRIELRSSKGTTR
jgi:hypothetical protein